MFVVCFCVLLVVVLVVFRWVVAIWVRSVLGLLLLQTGVVSCYSCG